MAENTTIEAATEMNSESNIGAIVSENVTDVVATNDGLLSKIPSGLETVGIIGIGTILGLTTYEVMKRLVVPGAVAAGEFVADGVKKVFTRSPEPDADGSVADSEIHELNDDEVEEIKKKSK